MIESLIYWWQHFALLCKCQFCSKVWRYGDHIRWKLSVLILYWQIRGIKGNQHIYAITHIVTVLLFIKFQGLFSLSKMYGEIKPLIISGVTGSFFVTGFDNLRLKPSCVNVTILDKVRSGTHANLCAQERPATAFCLSINLNRSRWLRWAT